jgi:hypothetical protein
MYTCMIRSHSISRSELASGEVERNLLGIIPFHMLLFVGFTIYPVSQASAHCEDYWTPEYKCLMGCGPCGGDSSAQQRNPAYNGQSSAEMIANMRAKAAAADAAERRAEKEQADRDAAADARAASQKAAHDRQAARQRQQDRKALSELHGLPQDSDPSLKGAVDETHSDQKVEPGTFGENVAKPNLAPRRPIAPGSDIKASASDQLLSAAAAGQNSGANFDTGGVKSSRSLDFMTGRELASSANPATFSTRVKNDPRMIAEMKQLHVLQAKRQQLDTERQQLITERNEADPAKMQDLTSKLDQKENDYQKTLTDISKQEQTVQKLHRTIDAEQEPSQPSSSQSK